MPSPERALSAADLEALDTPPLADVYGKASLDRAKLPPHFADVPDAILEGMRAGKKVFVLVYKPKGAGTNAEIAAEMHQFVHRGLAQDERFKDLYLWCPDDRDPRVEENTRSTGEFLTQATIEAEELGEKVEGLLRRLQGRKVSSGGREEPLKQGIVIALTPQLKALLGAERAGYFYSKLLRLDPAGTVCQDIASATDENFYTGLDRHVRGADVAEMERLLREAAKLAQAEPRVVPRAYGGFPAEWLQQEAQVQALVRIYRLLQLQLFSGNHLLMTGPAGVGKTTLLAAMYQLLKQTGSNALYRWWRQQVAREGLGKGLGDFLDSQDRLTTSYHENTFACIDQVEFGFDKADEDLLRSPAVSSYSAGTVFPHHQARLVMTSNEPGHVVKAKAAKGRSPDRMRERSLTTGAYLLIPERFVADDAPSPTTYREFIGRVFDVNLGGEDWGKKATGANEW